MHRPTIQAPPAPSTASAVRSTLHTSNGTSHARASTAVPSCAIFASTMGAVPGRLAATNIVASRADRTRSGWNGMPSSASSRAHVSVPASSSLVSVFTPYPERT